MESFQLDHAATGAFRASVTVDAESSPGGRANAAANGALAAPNETDLWGTLLPVGESASDSFASMQPVINVSHAPRRQTSTADPFDGFDAFASSTSLTLPPPAENAVVSLGSPLISFSPVACVSSSSAPISLDTTTTTMTTAVDDLLSFSFSPVAAPSASASASSSSLMMIDDFFFSSTSSASVSVSTSASHDTAATAFAAVATTQAEPSTSTLLSFSPVASPVIRPPQAALFADDLDVNGYSRGSFSGFDGEALIDHIAPHSAPAAIGNTDVLLQMPSQDTGNSLVADSAEKTSDAHGDEDAYVVPVEAEAEAEAEAVDVDASGDQDIDTAKHTAVVAAIQHEKLQALSPDKAFSPGADAWDQHGVQESEVSAIAEQQEATGLGSIVDSDTSGHDPTFQRLEDIGHFNDVADTSVVDEVLSPREMETRGAADLHDEVAAVAEHQGVVRDETVVESSVSTPEIETIDHSVAEACGSGDDHVSESVSPPVSSVAEEEVPDCQAQQTSGAEFVAGFDELSASSYYNLRSADVVDDAIGTTALLHVEDEYGQRDSDVEESRLDVEATALYAQREDDDDESDSVSGQRLDNPVLNVSVVQLHRGSNSGTQSPEQTCSSVASSPGSSVVGSAFAFIADGAASFAFAPHVSSLSPEPREKEHFERNDDCVAPVDPHHNAATEDDLSDAFEEKTEESEWTSGEFDVPASAEAELDCEERVDGNNGFPPETDFVPVEVATFTADNPELFFGFQTCTAVSGRNADDGDGFAGFDNAPQSPTRNSPLADQAIDASSGFESISHSTASPSISISTETDSSFGFRSMAQSKTAADDDDNDDDDDSFGGFGHSTTIDGSDDDDDFGDFGWGSSTVSGDANGDDDDDFGDFTPSAGSQQWEDATATATATASTTAVAASRTSWGVTTHEPQPVALAAPTNLDEFFGSAFPASKAPVVASLLPKPTPSHGFSMPPMAASAIFDQANGGAVYKSFHASLQEYRTMLTTEHDEHPHQQQPSFESEALRLKYLKYVLTEKLTEASRPDGVFPHGSEKYHLFASIAESGQEKNMRQALAQLQEGLFQGSVNEAVMRIAKQAALSAKARIAEQAAQQQAHTRGSLLATTRQFLSRSGGTSSSGGLGFAEKDGRNSRTGSGSLGVLTPTSASLHKMSRFAFPNGQESDLPGGSSGYGSGEDTGSDVSVGEASGHSEGDAIGAPGGSGPPSSGSSRSSGGLMKKFQERLTSFSSTKQRPRTVSLRRMGQSSEDVCQMELHMESINGGFDEVKWRCAVFLYETEEVAHLAPSQIKILAYPSNQLLSGKSDRSALSKFFKPGTIWSIDIGANSNAGVSME